jgi:hypothetical protein
MTKFIFQATMVCQNLLYKYEPWLSIQLYTRFVKALPKHITKQKKAGGIKLTL